MYSLPLFLQQALRLLVSYLRVLEFLLQVTNLLVFPKQKKRNRAEKVTSLLVFHSWLCDCSDHVKAHVLQVQVNVKFGSAVCTKSLQCSNQSNVPTYSQLAGLCCVHRPARVSAENWQPPRAYASENQSTSTIRDISSFPHACFLICLALHSASA